MLDLRVFSVAGSENFEAGNWLVSQRHPPGLDIVGCDLQRCSPSLVQVVALSSPASTANQHPHVAIQTSDKTSFVNERFEGDQTAKRQKGIAEKWFHVLCIEDTETFCGCPPSKCPRKPLALMPGTGRGKPKRLHILAAKLPWSVKDGSSENTKFIKIIKFPGRVHDSLKKARS